MSVDAPQIALQQVLLGGPRRTETTLPATSREREATVELSREFEALLLLQMLRQMRQSATLFGDEEADGLGASTMNDTIDFELARHLSRSGGVGLADMLQQALGRQVGADPAADAARNLVRTMAVLPALRLDPDRQPVVEPAGGAAPTLPRLPEGPPAMAPIRDEAAAPGDSSEPAAVPLPVAAAVTSRFGWRADPFGRGVRFHAGIDLAVPEGSLVPAVADGRVAAAGQEPGYGHTVVIEHAGGLATRYAHLSAIAVEVGQVVRTGEPIGRSGHSGRSTGPHLHFEVIQQGRLLNPEVAAARYAAVLKESEGRADSSGSRFSTLNGTAGANDED